MTSSSRFCFGLSLSWLALVLCAAFARADEATPSAADGVSIVSAETGIGGFYKVGKWTPIAVLVTVPEPTAARLEVHASDPEGQIAIFRGDETQLVPGQPQTLRAVFKVGRLEGQIVLRIVSGDRILAARTVSLAKRTSDSAPSAVLEIPAPREQSVRAIVTLGPSLMSDLGAAERGLSQANISIDAADALPTSSAEFDGIDTIIVVRPLTLPEAQDRAVREWVEQGGHLLINVGSSAAEFAAGSLAKWVPIKVDGSTSMADISLPALESFSRQSQKITFPGRLQAAKVVDDPNVQALVSGRDGALVVRANHGFGRVTLIAPDLSQPPLSTWAGRDGVLARLVGERAHAASSAGARSPGSHLRHTGITDLSTQIAAVQDEFPSIHRYSTWSVLGLIVAYLIVVGPLDYLLVHKLLKKPILTWLTFPLFVIAAALLSVWTAKRVNGVDVQVNQLSVVDVDAQSQAARTINWTNVYSPETRRFQLEVVPQNVAWGNAAAQTPPVQLGWNGVPERFFGGMYRPTGFEMGKPSYHVAAGRIDDLPITVWSSKGLVADWTFEAGKLVEGNLASPGPGRLEGSFVHHFPAPLEDWIVAYGNRVFRPVAGRNETESIPLEPDRPWSPDGPNVFPRDLASFLTGTTQARTSALERENKGYTAVVRDTYDTTGRNPADILRILTFHELVGGSEFTTLSNQTLSRLDLSGLLDLNRAIVYGRIDAPAASLSLDAQAVPAARQSTFVRIVLPVKQLESNSEQTAHTDGAAKN